MVLSFYFWDSPIFVPEFQHIIETMISTLPARLYKCQSDNVQTIDNLKNQTLWFSKPAQFNLDPALMK
jgi:hypothetical protein